MNTTNPSLYRLTSFLLLATLVLIPQLTFANQLFIDSLKLEMETATGKQQAKLCLDIVGYQNLYDIGLDSIDRYLELLRVYADAANYEKGKEQYYYYKGILEVNKGNYEGAIDAYQAFLPLAKEKKKKGIYIIGKSALATAYRQQGNYEKSLQQLLEAVEVAEASGELDELTHLYCNIAIIYDSKKEYDQSLAYYRKANQYVAMKKGKVQRFKIQNLLDFNMASAFIDVKQLDSAQFYVNKGMRDAIKFQDKPAKERLVSAQSTIYLEQGKYEAVLLLTDSLVNGEIYKKEFHNDIFFLASIHRKKALAYFHLENRPKAIQEIETALSIAEECSDYFCVSETYKSANEIYSGIGDYKKAHHYLTKYYAFQDSILGKEKQFNLQYLQELYESEKKERQLLELNQETQAQAFELRQRNLLIVFILAFGAAILLSYYLYAQQRLLKKQQSVNEAEQRLLRLQMNPHFLFNALSSIQTYVFNKEDTKKAIYYLSKFAELMRQVLEYSRETYIPLEDEIQTLENYLSLQQLRYNHDFQYQIEVDESINRWETMIPPLMAQPFVENAIEHGKVHTVENGYIKINIQKSNKKLLLTVEDNGIGRVQAIQVATKKKYKSLATSITQDRIKVLTKLTQQQFTFKINDLPNQGTQVVLEFPTVV